MANKVFFALISRWFRSYFFFYLFDLGKKCLMVFQRNAPRLPGSVRSGDVKSSAAVGNVILKIWKKRQNGWRECHKKGK